MERKYQEEIEKLKERLFFYTLIGSTIGYAIGCVLGHLDTKHQARKENAALIQKITSQENTPIHQKSEHVR
ncbi:MAG: hypothetical protein IKV03_04785 [Alphaproteobacteria bacterium]|nr:hypothetical protein [Alphaproteobacteria bacterium]